MRCKKIISLISALAIVMTSSLTASAYTSVKGDYYNIPLRLDNQYLTNGEYAIGDSGAKWVLEQTSDGDNQNKCKVANNNRSTGTNSLYLNARNGGNSNTPGVKMTLHLGQKTGDGTYTVQFDFGRQATNANDYVTLNDYEWQGGARLDSTTIWTKGSDFTNASNEAADVVYNTYTATFNTDSDDPQLSFGLFGGAKGFVDNIIIKDSAGRVIFDEDFEGGIKEQDGPEVPRHTYVQGNYYELPVGVHSYLSAGTYNMSDNANEKWVVTLSGDGDNQNKFRILENNASTGGRCLYLAARNGGSASDSQGSAKVVFHIGEAVGDGTYTIQYDMAREVTNWRDYITLNMDGWDQSKARLDTTTIWTKGAKITQAKGSKEWYRYTGTIKTTLNPEFTIGVYGYAMMFIDNIIIKDSTGAIVFSEGFEGGIPYKAEEPEEPDEEEGFKSPFEDYVDADCIPVGDYVLEGAENVIYHVRTNGNSSAFDKLRSTDASDGTRSLRLRANDSATSGTTLCAELTIEFGETTVGETYEVSFDAHREHSDWRDYAAINCDGWDGASRLTDTTKWTVTELGVGSEIGGVGDKVWSRYTAKFRTDYKPQINFAVAGWGELHIDNIVVKDSSGRIVFADSFEESGPIINAPAEPEEPEVPTISFPFEDYIDEYIPVGDYAITDKVIYHVRNNGADDTSVSIVRTADASHGARSYRIRSKDTTPLDRTLCTEFTIKFGEPTENGKYVISFDAWREVSSKYDYAALNYDGWDGPARLTDTTKWNVEYLGKGKDIGGVGEGEWSRYTATLSTIADDPQLNFAVAGRGELHIDNIVVKDINGNILLAESFETSGPIINAPAEPEEPEVPTISFPFEDYIDEYIPVGDYAITDKVIYHVRNNGADDTSVSIVRTADASHGARSYRIRSKDTEKSGKTLCTEFTIKFGEPTENGKYVISFDAWREVSSKYDYAALNYDGWDGSARLTDTTKWNVEYLGLGKDIGGVGEGEWSRYTATLSTIADDPQLNFAVAGRGELHIDNIVIKDTSGKLLFAESFEVGGPTIAGISPEVPEEPTGIIYDAEFKLVQMVGDKFKVIEDATNLTSNTFIMSVVKVENTIKANIYTALYRDNCLISFDGETIATDEAMTINSETVTKIPALGDGAYTLRIFVWDDDYNALKDAKVLGE